MVSSDRSMKMALHLFIKSNRGAKEEVASIFIFSTTPETITRKNMSS